MFEAGIVYSSPANLDYDEWLASQYAIRAVNSSTVGTPATQAAAIINQILLNGAADRVTTAFKWAHGNPDALAYLAAIGLTAPSVG